MKTNDTRGHGLKVKSGVKGGGLSNRCETFKKQAPSLKIRTGVRVRIAINRCETFRPQSK